jgi:hypothetical protein
VSGDDVERADIDGAAVETELSSNTAHGVSSMVFAASSGISPGEKNTP